MISVKYYSSWIREAGRGHLTVFLCWGSFLSYTIFSLLQLSQDTEYTFFGMGSSELLKLCMGLGVLLAAVEFFYLLQPAKLDFYYSLPVKKGTIFWCRYAHGLVHFLAPFTLSMCICSLYEGSVESRFTEAAGSYALHSILAFGAVFFIFYHMGIFAFAVSGRAVSAAGMLAVLLFYGPAVFRCVCAVYGRKLFDSFYRIPLWEKLEELLTVQGLSGKLSGEGLYEMQKVWEYVPERKVQAAAVFWSFILFFAVFVAQRKRKTEAVGRSFVFPFVERAVVSAVSVLAGAGAGSVVLEVSGGAGLENVKLAAALTAAGLITVVLVHMLMRRLLRITGSGCGKYKRRPVQLLAEGIAVCAVIAGFLIAAPRFDEYLPDREQVEKIGICVNGIGMSRKECGELTRGEESYTVEEKLKQYSLEKEGLKAGLDWIYDMRETRGRTASEQKAAREEGRTDTEVCTLSDEVRPLRKEHVLRDTPKEYTLSDEVRPLRKEHVLRDTPKEYTFVTVCYTMKNGQEIYRAYPVDVDSLQRFSAVYESREYKEKAYPAILKEEVSEERFTWTDGAAEQTLKLSGEEKQALLKAYQEDVGDLAMKELEGAAPCGMLKMESQVKGRISRVYIYSFFKRTCEKLREKGVAVEKDILDYPVHSLYVREAPGGDYSLSAGGQWYTKEEEIQEWKGRLICQELDIQTILCPLGYSREADVVIEEPESGAAVEVSCYDRQ